MKRKEMEAFLEDRGFAKFSEAKRGLYLCPFGFVELIEDKGKFYIKHVVNEQIEIEE